VKILEDLMKKIGFSILLSALLLTTAFANGTEEQGAAANLAATLDINFCQGNNARTMTYQKSDPLTLPDGTIVSQGDLKPTWQYISEQIGVQIVDVAVQDQKASEMVDIAAATGFNDAVIYGGNSVTEDLMNYGAQGYFINIKDYLDKMPAVKAYLGANPNVAKSITAYNGGIYHLPYVAEIDNYARVFCARADWITSLLDSSSSLESESHTLNVAYEGYWDRNSTNVIALQNAAAKSGVLDRNTALKVLVDYINDTYNYAKPSDLFIGDDAQYDIDELVALWRVVELSPNTLSKVSTGSVVPGAEISPFFVRKAKYREDTLRLINYFDGERVHASDSYKARLYDDGKGNIVYSYASESFDSKLDYIQQMYSEGLIHSEFADLSVKDEFRKSMFFADNIEGQKQFGFMTYDWIASTTAGSDKIIAVLPPVTTISGAGINKYVHYMENTRVIKPDGWSISASASQEEINAALTLFNYMFTEEGNTVQNYSIPACHEGIFVGPDGTEYPKFTQWMFDAAGEYKNGDVSGFLRDFMGSHLALGYQKEIGFELQYTSNNGPAAWELYTKAGVITPSYGSKDAFMRLMPPVISLTEQNLAKLATVSVGDGQVESIFMYITGLDPEIKSGADIRSLYEDAGLDIYLDVYKTAYDRMMAK
jgi:hypothetical protein